MQGAQQYLVSARKYRPQQFRDVVGQGHITSTLINAIKNDQLAQAFLFCGPRGVGKTTCARILAKVINAENPVDFIERGDEGQSIEDQAFNIFELDAASNSGVDKMRELLEQVRFAPQSGKYKIYIIDEVHMLSTAAFNAFLKTLEEPPPYAIFILATTEKHKILPTIISRCQVFDFKRISITEMVEQLKAICEKEGIEADQRALHLMAAKADGAMRDALSIFDRALSFSNQQLSYETLLDQLNILDHSWYFKITEALLTKDHQSALLLFDQILSNGFDGEDFINGLASHFRDLMVASSADTIQLLEMAIEIEQQYSAQAKLLEESYVLTALNLANNCALSYKTSNNKRLLVELALMKMAHISDVFTPETSEKKNLNQPVEKPVGTVEKPKSSGTEAPPQVEAKPAEVVAQKEVTGSGFKALSLEAFEKKVEEERQQKLDENEGIVEAEIIEQRWSVFVERVESAREKAIAKGANCKIDHSGLRAEVNNSLNKTIVEKIARDFVQSLMAKGIKNELKIEVEIVKDALQENTKPYTVKEKYRAMVEANPELLRLVQQLGLELEY